MNKKSTGLDYFLKYTFFSPISYSPFSFLLYIYPVVFISSMLSNALSPFQQTVSHSSNFCLDFHLPVRASLSSPTSGSDLSPVSLLGTPEDFSSHLNKILQQPPRPSAFLRWPCQSCPGEPSFSHVVAQCWAGLSEGCQLIAGSKPSLGSLRIDMMLWG